jgi:hypothetical protein
MIRKGKPIWPTNPTVVRNHSQWSVTPDAHRDVGLQNLVQVDENAPLDTVLASLLFSLAPRAPRPLLYSSTHDGVVDQRGQLAAAEVVPLPFAAYRQDKNLLLVRLERVRQSIVVSRFDTSVLLRRTFPSAPIVGSVADAGAARRRRRRRRRRR